jgi:hypothetical protein
MIKASAVMVGSGREAVAVTGHAGVVTGDVSTRGNRRRMKNAAKHHV